MGAASLLLFVMVALAWASGCWGAPDKDLIIENGSSEVVVYFEDGVPVDLLQPGVTHRTTIPPFTGTSMYSVQSFETRKVLAERTYTWNDIVREDGFKIVIQ